MSKYTKKNKIKGRSKLSYIHQNRYEETKFNKKMSHVLQPRLF